jgi:ammonium transporter Rh
MSFIKTYGLGAVGFTMILSVLAIQMNIMVEYAMRAMYKDTDETFPMQMTMTNLIDGEFAAATLLISFGAVIGRASPLQMLIMMIFQSIFYSFNKVFLVFGYIAAEDVGGTLTIHLFGAYFGLAVSAALGPSEKTAEQDKISDIFAFVGTTILWVFWPSFVSATETSHPEYAMRCVSNTLFALLASTTATFFTSHILSTTWKFDPVHIANATLAGGVAIGASGRLITSPGGAVVVGAVAGVLSVMGYVYVSPLFENRLNIFDTCGVGNLHGLPALLGGIASIIFVAMIDNSEHDFLEYSKGEQCGRQAAAMVATFFVAILSGGGTGQVMALFNDENNDLYTDNTWWKAEYFEASRHARAVDPSVH